MTLLKTLRQATLAVSLCRRHPAVSKKKQMPLIQLGVWNDKGYQPKLGICLNVLDQKPTWFHSIPPFATRSVIFQSCSRRFFFAVFHFQSPYRSIATNFASLPRSTKALGEAARQFGAETFNRFNP